MAADQAPLTVLLGVVSACLELGLLGLALYRGLHRRLPVLTGYIAAVVVREAVGFWVLARFGWRSSAYYYLYWVSQAVFLTLRGFVVAELLHAILRPYRGVWAIARFALSGIAVFLVAYAALASATNASRAGGFVLAADRGMEVAVVGTLVTLLLVCRYYGVVLDRLTACVIFGLAVYSLADIVNNTILFAFLSSYKPVWSVMRRVSYDAAILIWLWPLLRPVPEQAAEQILIAPNVYQEMVPEFSGRMRELNDRLLEILQR